MRHVSLEFKGLLNDRLPDILFKEARNARYIYLYRAGRYWLAFEKSAFRLSNVCASAMLYPIKISTAPFPIVAASVEYDELVAAVEGMKCLEISETDMIYECGKYYRGGAYDKWHDRETEILRS